MNIVQQLLGDLLLISPEKSKDTVSNTGIISQLNDNTEHRGYILQVGPGLYSANGILIPMTCKVGDLIVYRKSSNDVKKIDGIKYDLIREQMVEYIAFPETEILSDDM